MNYLAATWYSAKFPPDAKKGKWSKEVIALTVSGRTCQIAYMPEGDDGPGVWQRPKERAALGSNGRVVAWTDLPSPEDFE